MTNQISHLQSVNILPPCCCSILTKGLKLFPGQGLPLSGGSGSGGQDAGREFGLQAGQDVGGGDEEELVGPHGHLDGKNDPLLHPNHLCHKV
jgi:hypothetical protein